MTRSTRRAQEEEIEPVLTGRKYQAQLPKLIKSRSGLNEQPDRDELMWTPPNENLKFDYEKLKNEYWIALWRKLNGGITMEVALQWLMNNDYSTEKCSNWIDKVAKKFPDQFQPPRMVDFDRFKSFLSKMEDLQKIEQNFVSLIVSNYSRVYVI